MHMWSFVLCRRKVLQVLLITAVSLQLFYQLPLRIYGLLLPTSSCLWTLRTFPPQTTPTLTALLSTKLKVSSMLFTTTALRPLELDFTYEESDIWSLGSMKKLPLCT